MRVGEAIKAMRFRRDIGVREMGREIGVSPATLSRVERGMPCDGVTMVKLFRWLFGDDERVKRAAK